MSRRARVQRQVSVRGVTYDRLRVAAEERGVSIAALVEAACMPVPDQLAVEPAPEPHRFTCALCVRELTEVPAREPFGRGGALVDVCSSCSFDPPRTW